jgi:hypothetical protein
METEILASTILGAFEEARSQLIGRSVILTDEKAGQAWYHKKNASYRRIGIERLASICSHAVAARSSILPHYSVNRRLNGLADFVGPSLKATIKICNLLAHESSEAA